MDNVSLLDLREESGNDSQIKARAMIPLAYCHLRWARTRKISNIYSLLSIY